MFVCKLPLYFPRMGTCSKFKREKAKGVSLTLSGLEGAWESPTWGLMTVIMHDEPLLIEERGQESPERSRHCLTLSCAASVVFASVCGADQRAYGKEVHEK